MPGLLAFCKWLEQTAVGAAIKGSGLGLRTSSYDYWRRLRVAQHYNVCGWRADRDPREAHAGAA